MNRIVLYAGSGNRKIIHHIRHEFNKIGIHVIFCVNMKEILRFLLTGEKPVLILTDPDALSERDWHSAVPVIGLTACKKIEKYTGLPVMPLEDLKESKLKLLFTSEKYFK